MKQKYEKKENLRPLKVFSDVVRKQTVKDIELGKCTVLQASRELCCSQQTIYNWIYLYSRYLEKNKILVVEDKSEGYKSKELELKVRDLEAAIGRKQMEIDLLNKVIDLANSEYQTDLKKNLSPRPLSGLEPSKGSNTNTK
jgi:hypothetical protein